MKKSLWQQVKEVVNTYNDGEIFTRKHIRKKLNYPKGGSFDLYRLALTQVGVLEQLGNASFKKHCSIPDTFTTTQLNKLRIELQWKTSWKDWFITLEDRMKSM